MINGTYSKGIPQKPFHHQTVRALAAAYHHPYQLAHGSTVSAAVQKGKFGDGNLSELL
jgi:hypothetical protein